MPGSFRAFSPRASWSWKQAGTWELWVLVVVVVHLLLSFLLDQGIVLTSNSGSVISVTWEKQPTGVSKALSLLAPSLQPDCLFTAQTLWLVGQRPMAGGTKVHLEWITRYIQNLVATGHRPSTYSYLFSSQPVAFVLILKLHFLLVHVLFVWDCKGRKEHNERKSQA